jgi:hypothetical protein
VDCGEREGGGRCMTMEEDGMHLKTVESSYSKDRTWGMEIDVLIS